MGQEYDIVIVGGGPGGSAAAACSVKHGLRTCLIDKEKFPRDKVCGDFVLIDALQVFERCKIDTSDLPLKHYKSKGVDFVIGNYTAEYRHPPALGVLAKRVDFDMYLLSKVKPNIDLFDGYTILSIENSANGYEITIRNNADKDNVERIYTRYIIGADGSSSYIRRHFFKDFQLEYAIATREYCKVSSAVKECSCYYFTEIERGGYFWVFPINEHEINCGVGVFTDHWKNSFSTLLEAHQYYKKKVLSMDSAKENVRSWGLPLNTTIQKCCTSNVLLVGDAAGMVHPFFGHGIDTAIFSSEIALHHIAAHRRNDNYDLEGMYSKDINDKFIEKYIVFKQFRDEQMEVNDKMVKKIYSVYGVAYS